MRETEKYLDDKERKLIFLDEIDSTNNYAKKIADAGAGHGTAVIAACQTAGRGRLGRSFVSPRGTSIYMSVILRLDCPLERVSMITPLAAVAAARAADRICGTSVRIKWVNDLFLNGKKICGILTESRASSDGKAEYTVVGIGMNVRSVKNIFDSELIRTASSIEDETGEKYSIDRIAAEILNELDRLLPELESGGFIDEYRSRSCVIGCDVEVTKSGRIAHAVGISDSAGLIIEYPDGTREELTTGEANIIKSTLRTD